MALPLYQVRRGGDTDVQQHQARVGRMPHLL
jgi:hypothetical protein